MEELLPTSPLLSQLCQWASFYSRFLFPSEMQTFGLFSQIFGNKIKKRTCISQAWIYSVTIERSCIILG